MTDAALTAVNSPDASPTPRPPTYSHGTNRQIDGDQIVDYEKHALAYAASNDTNLFNAYYERPAMLDLIGDVNGKRILDAGCGHGRMIEELRARGATASGFDASPSMLALATQNLGAKAGLQLADLNKPLPHESNSFDIITSSLVLHYLKEWHEPLTELRRILTEQGTLHPSVNHPLTYGLDADQNYFDHIEHSFDAPLGDKMVEFRTWHRPLSSMAQAFLDAGFYVTGINEPSVADNTPESLLPESIRTTRRFVCMIFFTLTPRPGQ